MGRFVLKLPPSSLKQPTKLSSTPFPLVFLAEDVFLSPIFFSTSPAPFKNGVFQRCSPSRIFDKRGRAASLTGPRR